MKKWKRIIIHHSASSWGTAHVIDGWHKARGWSGIGYHFVILNGIVTHEDWKHKRVLHSLIGSIETGRPMDLDGFAETRERGAHAYGFNMDSIGICLIHCEGPYHSHMNTSLIKLVDELRRKFSISIDNILGHCEIDSKKPLCPSFDMDMLRHIIGGMTHERKEVPK